MKISRAIRWLSVLGLCCLALSWMFLGRYGVNSTITPEQLNKRGGTVLVFEVVEPGKNYQPKQMVTELTYRLLPSRKVPMMIRAPTQNEVTVTMFERDKDRVQAVIDRAVYVGKFEFGILAHPKVDSIDVRRAISASKKQGKPTSIPGYYWRKIAAPGGFPIQHSSVVDESGRHIEDADGELEAILSQRELFVLTKRQPSTLRVVGDHVVRAQEDSSDGKAVILVEFNEIGSKRFAALTKKHSPTADGMKFRISIEVDNVVVSAPSIESTIHGGRAIIHGMFTQQEINDHVAALNSMSLPATLKLKEKKTVEPSTD